MQTKSQAFKAFQQYKAFIKLQTDDKIKALQTDNGKEYISTNLFNSYNNMV